MAEGLNNLIEGIRCTGGEVDLRSRPATALGLYDGKKDYKKQLRSAWQRLRDLQRQLFVDGSQALLIILQGMDTSGKDGIIRHVLRAFNPQGCRVYSFRAPNAEEQAHDFLWRTSRFLPERGQVSVFNRSHYEEVLVVRVHPELLKGQHLASAGVADGSIWDSRYEAIKASERHLISSGTRIVKLMLHISPEEQARRLIARFSDPAKAWKSDASDIEERRYWDDYVKAYSACVSATSTPAAPWYVVPADDKLTARLVVAGILIETLETMAPALPQVTEARSAELTDLRERLTRSQMSREV